MIYKILFFKIGVILNTIKFSMWGGNVARDLYDHIEGMPRVWLKARYIGNTDHQ